MMPVSLCSVGQTVTIKRIKGDEKIQNHLKNLGFVEGSQITVMNKVENNVILQVKEARIAIDHTMAKYVLV